MSESSVGGSSEFVGRQSVMSDRSGLCNIVSSIGAVESMVTICPLFLLWGLVLLRAWLIGGKGCCRV